MKRSVALASAAALAVLGVALVAILLFRAAFLEKGLEWWLRQQGIDGPDVVVRAVSLDRVHLERVRLGPEGALSAERVEIGYTPSGLAQGTVRSVEVTGLHAQATIGPDGVALAGLPDLTAGPASGGGLAITAIVLRDARIDVRTQAGEAIARIDGTIQWETPRRMTGGLRLAVETARGRIEGALAIAAPNPDEIEVRYGIEEGRLRLANAEMAGLSGHAALLLRQGAVASAELNVRMPETSLFDRRTGIAVEVEGAFAGTNARLAVSLEEEETDTRAHTTLHVSDPLGQARLTFEAQGVLSAVSGLWSMAGLDAPSAGEVRLALAGQGAARGDGLEGLASALAGGITLQANAALDVDNFGYPGVGEGMTARVRGRIEVSEDVATLALDEPATVRWGSVDRALTERRGAPAWIRDVLGEALSLRLDGDDGAPFRIALHAAGAVRRLEIAGQVAAASAAGGIAVAHAGGHLEFGREGRLRAIDLPRVRLVLREPPWPGLDGLDLTVAGSLAGSPSDGLSGTADLALLIRRLESGTIRAEGVALRAPLAIETGGGTAIARLAAPGRVEADRIAAGDTVALGHPLNWRLVETRAPLARIDFAPPDGPAGRLGISLSLRGEEDVLEFPRAGGEPLRLAMAETHLEVDARLGDGKWEGSEATFRAGLSQPERPAWISPLKVIGSLRQANGTLSLQAEAQDAQNVTRARFGGTHDPGTRTDLSLRIRSMAFAPDGLQPAALFPILAAFRDVRGKASAELRFQRTPGGTSSGGDIRLEGLSFRHGNAVVRDLNSVVRLDDLFPVSTAGAQTLSIGQIDMVTALKDVRARFQFEAQGGPQRRPRLSISSARATLANGEIAVEDVVVAAGVVPQGLTLKIRGVKIEPLLQMIGLEDLRGTGTLSGQIPIRLPDGQVAVIDHGRLAAEGKGVIQMRSEQAAQALASGGQAAELVVRALEDFHYDELSIDIDKAAGGDAQVFLRLRGNNPAVLEGHPFVFNISVTSNVDELIEVLLRGYRLTTDMLREATGHDGDGR